MFCVPMFRRETAVRDDRPLHRLGVTEIVRGLAQGRFDAADVVRSCLRHAQARDGALHAWVELAVDDALAAAVASDPDARLRGVPFGVKDVFDTGRMPTRMGSRLYEAHRPPYDAGCVAQLRQAGAIALGKTATCEFAGTDPAPTVHPFHPAHTPGGSSSGSAAAVAAHMVPLAIGSQTGGSVLRPAAFCGVVGFKPTYGFYSIAGMKPAAHSFDTPGLFARSVDDAALVHAVLMNDEVTAMPDRPPRIGVFRTHLWPSCDAAAARSFDASVDRLGRRGAILTDVAMPAGFERITERRAVINAFERARNLAGEWIGDAGQMRPRTVEVCRRGLGIGGADYAAARRDVEGFRSRVVDMFDGLDCIVTPVAPGEAPEGLAGTGDPRLQELWTMLHLPSISVPAGSGASGLPLGLQLVGNRFDDAALLAVAQWVERALAVAEAA